MAESLKIILALRREHNFHKIAGFILGSIFGPILGAQMGGGKPWFSRPCGRDGLGPLPWRPQEPSERSQEPSQEASRAVREPSRAAQEASRVVWATSTSRPGGPRPSQAASAAARKGPEAPKEASNGIRERSQSPQSHGPTFSAHTARPIRTKGGFPNRGGRGGVNPFP